MYSTSHFGTARLQFEVRFFIYTPLLAILCDLAGPCYLPLPHILQ